TASTSRACASAAAAGVFIACIASSADNHGVTPVVRSGIAPATDHKPVVALETPIPFTLVCNMRSVRIRQIGFQVGYSFAHDKGGRATFRPEIGARLYRCTWSGE